MKRIIVSIGLCILVITLCSCGVGTSESNPNTSGQNVTKLEFCNEKDINLIVGKTSTASWVKASVKDTKSFSPSDVIFVSENEEVATISFKEEALHTYLYYTITAVSPGETSVFVKTADGSVISERVKVIVVDDGKKPSPSISPKPRISLEEITPVLLDELQTMFCNLPQIADRESVKKYIKEHGLTSYIYTGERSFLVGADFSAVTFRPRDRSGPVIGIEFSRDGILERFGYTFTNPYSFENFDLRYENGQFSCYGENYETGEDAIQVFIANEKQ